MSAPQGYPQQQGYNQGYQGYGPPQGYPQQGQYSNSGDLVVYAQGPPQQQQQERVVYSQAPPQQQERVIYQQGPPPQERIIYSQPPPMQETVIVNQPPIQQTTIIEQGYRPGFAPSPYGPYGGYGPPPTVVNETIIQEGPGYNRGYGGGMSNMEAGLLGGGVGFLGGMILGEEL